VAIKTRSSSTSDLPKKVGFLGRSHVLHPLIDADKYEALCVQLEIVRLNGICELDMIKSLVDTIDELCKDVTQLKSDNTALKTQIKDLQDLVDIQPKQPKLQPQGSSSSLPGLQCNKEVRTSCNVASQQKSTPGYADVVNSARQPCTTKPADETAHGSADNGFISVTGTRKNNRSLNKATNSIFVPYKKSRTHIIWVRYISTIPVITNDAKSKYLFISRFNPNVATEDIKKSRRKKSRFLP
jgi:hypothetical protein